MLGLGRGEIKWGRDWSNSGFGIILGWREGGEEGLYKERCYSFIFIRV